MKDITSYFADYASYHQTPGNKLFHRLGIPMIMLTLIGMLARVGAGHLNAAVALIVFSTVIYFMLEWRLAIATPRWRSGELHATAKRSVTM